MTNNYLDLSASGRAMLPVHPRDAAVLTPEFLYDPPASEAIDLRSIWSAIWRHRLLTLSIVAAALALGVLSLFLMQPIYRATASVEIANQPVKVLGTEDFQQTSGQQETDRLLQTQIDILKSRALAQRVSDGLNLAANDRFLKSVGISPKPSIRGEQVISALRGGVIASLPRNSRVVPVAFESNSPAMAASVANSYAENLIAGNLQRHFDTSSYSKDFLQNQLTLTKARLESSERSLLDYARSVGLVDPSAGAGDPSSSTNNAPRSLTSANLIDLNQSLAAARNNRIQAEGRWRQAQATPLMSLPDVLTNPAIQQMMQKRAELESTYQQELQHRRPEHPSVQQAAAAVRELDRNVGTLASSIRNSIRNQYATAQTQESQLSGTVQQLKGATLAEQSLGIRYNILKREVDTNRQLYDGLLQRYKEVSAEAGVTSNNISVVDRATAPLLPVAPSPMVNMALALFAGLIMSAIAITFLEVFHDGVRSPDEIEQRFALPVLGVVPRLQKGLDASTELANPESQVSEAYQSVRTSVQLSTQGGTPRSLLVTSSTSGEGKSTTALAIARAIAATGKTVLVLDADLRRPSMHQLLGIPKAPGLSNLLTEQLTTESVIHATDTPGLSVIPAGPKPPSPAQLLSGKAFSTLLNYLKDHFDHVIVDSPPVLGLADAPSLSATADGTLMVIEANRSHRGAIDAAMRRLTATRSHIIGAVLLKFDPKKVDVGESYMLEYYAYAGSNDTGEQRESA
jgi:succinoglycan biosynthesis transport protein ExoP